MSKAFYYILIVTLIGLSLSTVCRDGSQCPGTSTCCLTPRGVGCCPYENANCCGDGLHCCPYGYNCSSDGKCVQSSGNKFQLFLAEPIAQEAAVLTPSTPAEEITTKVNFDLSFPSINDIIKCVTDVQPVVKEVIEIVNLLRDGKTDEAMKLLPELAIKGTALVADCGKVVKSPSVQKDQSIYLDFSFPSISDIIKCVTDVQPVVKEVIQIVNLLKEEKYQEALTLLPHFASSGMTLVTDCGKLVKSSSLNNDQSVYLEYSFPSILDIIKCVSNVPLVVKEVTDIVNLLKEEKYQEAYTLLPQLARSGMNLVTDCGKLVNSSSLKNDQSVYLEYSFPSITDIIKCVTDVPPVVSQVIDIVNLLREGKNDEALKLLPQLASSGLTLISDCKKFMDKQTN
jgi:hypothetical protein